MSTYVHVGVFNAPRKCQFDSPIIRHTVQQRGDFAIALQYVKQSNRKIC